MKRALLVPAGVLAVYTVATIVCFWPWLPNLSAALIGPPEDNMQDFWGTYYVAAAPREGPFFFTTLIRFPEGTPLYYHAIALPKVFVIAALTHLVGTDTATLVLLHNLAVLVSFPLAGLGAYLLVRHLTGSGVGAMLGGFVFAFNPAHVMHSMHHLPFSSMEFLPFFAYAYLIAVESQHVGWLAGAVVFYALSAWSHAYYIFYHAYFVVFHTAVDAVRRRALPTGWRLVAPLVCLLGTVIALSPLVIPMAVAAMTNPSVYAEGHGQVADLAAYVAFPPYHLLSFLGQGVYERITANPWEGTVYLGVVNLAVVAWFVRARGLRDVVVGYCVAGMIVFGVLASGARLHVLGQPTVPMPDMLLSRLPFFSNVRGPSRAVVLIYLFLAVLIGHAFGGLWRTRRTAAARWALVGLAALAVIDFAPARALPMTRVSCPPGLQVIRDDPDRDFGVLNLPSGRPAAYLEGNYYMLDQVCHGRPICQGTTARDVVRTLRDRLETADLAAQQRQLTAAKVKYIVINHPIGRLFRWRDGDGPRAQYPVVYPVAYEGPDMTVLRVY